MRLGEIARVARGAVTGNRALFIMTRVRAKEFGLEPFVKPILAGAREIPKSGSPIARDHPDREVILVASRRDVEEHPALRAYLGHVAPRLANVRAAPIAATYVGVPRFVANPDGLVVTNALYTLTPRQNLSPPAILMLVERLNRVTAAWPRLRHAERLSPRQFEALEI